MILAVRRWASDTGFGSEDYVQARRAAIVEESNVSDALKAADRK
jgi:hypothetical protein